jgi:hypothetical protein
MKKITFTLTTVSFICLITASVMKPSNALGQQENPSMKISMPDSVAMILAKSCIGCHDSGGSKLASSKWSYSGWASYSDEKQAKKSDAMCRAITKGSMPPKKVRKENPEKIPTAAQIETICKWAASLNKK